MPPLSPPTRAPVDLRQIAPRLRVALGVAPFDLAPVPPARLTVAPLPDTLPSLDVDAWLAWSLAGLPLFATPELPTLRAATLEARAALLIVALDRTGGNITHTAALLGTSRHGVRSQLETAGLYRPARASASR